MSRAEIILYKDKPIIQIDLSHLQPNDIPPVLKQAYTLISKCEVKSALVLTDVTDAVYNKEVAQAIKDFVSKNTPYIKASAVVGADGIRLVLLQTVIMLSRREIKTCKTRDDAKAWLASIN